MWKRADDAGKVDFDAFTSMSEEERKDYANGWLYIHQKAKK